MATVKRGELRQFQGAFSDTWAIKDTFNFGSVADGNEEATAITVSGVGVGDMVLGVATSSSAQDLNLIAQVTGADTIEFQVENNTGGAIDLATATYTCFVGRPNW
jgi:hypothetical protein|tara:strand:- start:314 stop:628 length:315 start_codon:yes stop_codon:yes gene_type:complete